jgi:hypothetical protein
MALSRLDYCLVHLIEEASEIQKAATKALRFGIDHIDTKNGKTNKDNIVAEMYDLGGIKRILESEFNFPLPDERFIDSQQIKGEQMFEYAKSLGRVTEWENEYFRTLAYH